MRINELFKPNYEWDWTYQSNTMVKAEFRIKNQLYKFIAYYQDDLKNGGESWEIVFELVDPARSFPNYGITGTGNSAEVFAIVVTIIGELLERRPDIVELVFTADEPSRQSLYKRMVSRLLPSWTLSRPEEHIFVLNKNLPNGK